MDIDSDTGSNGFAHVGLTITLIGGVCYTFYKFLSIMFTTPSNDRVEGSLSTTSTQHESSDRATLLSGEKSTSSKFARAMKAVDEKIKGTSWFISPLNRWKTSSSSSIKSERSKKKSKLSSVTSSGTNSTGSKKSDSSKDSRNYSFFSPNVK